MKLFRIKFFYFLLLIFFVCSNLPAKNLKATYVVEIGAINLGTVKWSIDLENNNYKTHILLDDKGLFSGLYKFEGNYSSGGIIVNGKYISSEYLQHWKTKQKTRDVKILFDKERVSDLVIKPEETEQARVNFKEVDNLVGPLASFLNILTNDKNEFKTFDGRRLYNMYIENIIEEKEKVIKKIVISDYVNIWADHKRNDLKFIVVEQPTISKDLFFPSIIKIKNKGLVFKLTKI